MNGIKCRNCNRSNPIGSKFCNNCGTTLPPQTTQICENCGTANPQNRLYCDNCGHRLVAATPRPSEDPPPSETPATPPSRHGFMLPSRRPGDTGELDPDDLPEWLRTGERPNAEPDPERQSRITDWLHELTDLKDEEEAEQPFTIDYGFLERPKWPGRASPEESQPPSAKTSEGGLPSDIFDDILDEPDAPRESTPDWLAEMKTATPAAADQADEEWLDDTFSDLEEQDEAAPSPTADWLSDFDTHSETDDADVAEWLSDLSPPSESSFTTPDDGWLSPSSLPEPDKVSQAPVENTESWYADFSLDSSPEEMPAEDNSNEWFPEWDQVARDETPRTVVSDWLTTLDKEDDTGENIASTSEDEPSIWDEAENFWDGERQQPDDADVPLADTDQEPTAWDETPRSGKSIVSDWLTELEAPEPSSESRTVSDWLTDFDKEDAAAEPDGTESVVWPGMDASEDAPYPTEAAAEPMPADELDLSSWLQELESQDDTADDVTVVASTHLSEDDFPEWLADSGEAVLPAAAYETEDEALAASDLAPSEAAPERTGATEIPDWLAELRTTDTTFLAPLEEKPTESISGAEDDAAAWLDEVRDTEPEPVTPLPPHVPETVWETGDEDEFLPPSDSDMPEVSEGLTPAELPDWLQASLSEGNVVSTGANKPLDLSLPQDDLPEWLNPPTEGDFDSALEAALSVQGSEMGGALGSEWKDILGDEPLLDEMLDLEQADIPEWIQELKPRQLTGLPPEVEEEPEQPSGPLEGLRGVIPIEPIIAQPKTNLAAANPFTVTKEHQQQAALLHQLITAEPKIVTRVGQRPQAMSLLVRLGLSLLLLGAVLLGLFLPWIGVSLPLVMPEPLPGVAAAQSSIAAAGGSTALIAFEYTPGMAGELDPQAQLIINQLTANGKQIVAVSQFAAGLGQANSLEIELADSQFIPGETIGLRTLASCLEDAAGCPFSFNPGDVGLIVVLTAERDSLVAWVEQVGTQTDIPLVVGTTQGLAPVAQPYLESGQLAGLIAGLPGAAAYEQAVTGQAGEVDTQLQAQTLAQLLAVGIFLVGALYYGVAGRKRTQ